MAGGARAGTSASGRGVALPRGLCAQIAAGTGAGEWKNCCWTGRSAPFTGRSSRKKSQSVKSQSGIWPGSRRLDRSGPKLNAIRTIAPDALDVARQFDDEIASGRIRGPLHGIPIVLKDNILTGDGMTAAAGAAALAGFKPGSDATLVRRLRQAGALILGKTNLTEFADYVSDVMPSGFSGAGGMVKNPHGDCRLRARPWLERGISGGGCRVVGADRNWQRDAELDPNSCVRVFSFRVQAECWNGQPGWRGSAGTQPGFARSACAFGGRRSAAHVGDRRCRLPR